MSLDEPVRIELELEPHEAAALVRLCDKFAHSDASAYLYPHVSAAIREAQGYAMVHATNRVFRALTQAGVSGWPWIETGTP
jgi:hypothetical protein